MSTTDNRDWKTGRALLIIVTGLLLSCLALANAISNVSAKSNPQLALALWSNGDAQLAQTDRLLAKLDEKKVQAELVSLTKASVRHYPLNAGIIRNYALAMSFDNASASSRALDVAELISRRDLGAQMALAANAAKSDDINGALRHFNIALSTNVSSHQLIFPVLSQVIDDKAGAESLAEIIRNKPLWTNDFVSFVLAQDEEAESLAKILRMANGVPAGPQKAVLESRIIQALANSGSAAELKAFYLSLDGASAELATSAQINPEDFVIAVPPISWSMTRTPDILTEFVEKQSALKTQLGFGSSGVIAQKLLFLSPGDYEITMDSEVTGQESGASVFWNLFCVSKSAPLELMISNIQISAPAVIDGSCPAQLLEIRGNSGSGPNGSTGLISGFDIQRRTSG